ncbi:unnamed protein product [Absidia cylindrospora]
MANNSTKFLLACHDCGASEFSTKDKLRNHLKKHDIQVTSTLRGRPAKKQRSEALEADTYYVCSCCVLYYKTLEELGEHITVHLSTGSTVLNECEPETSPTPLEPVLADASGQEIETVTLPERLSVPDLEHQQTIHVKEGYERSYEDSILDACQKTNSNMDDKKKTLFIVDALQLKPFSIISELGTEHSALSHPTVIKNVTSSLSTIRPIVPNKRPFYEADSRKNTCTHCITDHPIEIESLLTTSPHRNILNTRSFVELSDDLCTLLNTDWEFYTNMKYVSAQLLAGAILLNRSNGQSIMINTVETYGRTKMVDVHREPFGMKKQCALSTSIPPPLNTRYPDIWPTTTNNIHGTKLVIGTHAFNALVTSSLRLDQLEPAMIGAATMNFDLQHLEDSLAIGIYLDQAAVKKALALAANKDCVSITNHSMLGQLRQLNTNFHCPTTYLLCRASGPITGSHACQPYSIFTLATFDKGRNPAATIFNKIAIEVLKHGAEAQLTKDLIAQCIESLSDGQLNDILVDILDLFEKDGADAIPILNNNTLNKHLESLASRLHPYIHTANKSVGAAILDRFRFLD